MKILECDICKTSVTYGVGIVNQTMTGDNVIAYVCWSCLDFMDSYKVDKLHVAMSSRYLNQTMTS